MFTSLGQHHKITDVPITIVFEEDLEDIQEITGVAYCI